MKKILKDLLPKLIFFLIVSIVVIIILFSTNDIQSVFSEIGNSNGLWLLVCLCVLIIYMLINQISLFLLTRPICPKFTFIDAFLIGSTEYFFNGITPFASGGQPFQVYAYNKVGISPSKSTGVLLINYVCYQLCIVICCFVSLIYYKELKTSISNVIPMLIIGIIINVLVLLIFFGIGKSSHFRLALTALLRKIISFKIFRGRGKNLLSKFESYCVGVQEAFNDLLSHKLRSFFAILFKLIAQFIYFSIPFFILKALGIEITFSRIFFVIAMTTFAVAMTCFIPTPGASGGIEIAFKQLFISITGVTPSVAVSGMILWRGFTYYLLMLFSFIIYVVFVSKAKPNRYMNCEETINEATITENEDI